MTENFQIFAPQNFNEYVGQNKAKKIAQVMVGASKVERRSLPNIMITGPYGTGKTTLAKVILNEMGRKAPIIDASSINKDDLIPRGTVIVDEIHNIEPAIADSLNIEIDKGTVSIIGCTTNPGMIPPAFRSRFRSIDLQHYTVADIQHIVDLAAIHRHATLTVNVRSEVARRSRLNPRVALNNLSFIFDLMAVKGKKSATLDLIKEAFDTLSIDANGYTDRDYSYMAALSDDRPVGLAYLASVTGIDAKTVEREIEPYLLQTKKIDRLPRGRIKLMELT